MALYRLLSGLNIDGKSFKEGENVELDGNQADELREIIVPASANELSGIQDDGKTGEKPLNKMNADELFAKAAELGIEVDPNATKKQVLEAIQSFKEGENA